MDDIKGVVLLQEEPLDSILGKWLAWTLTMVIFIMLLIYFSNYFAKSTECLSSGPPPIHTTDAQLKYIYQNRLRERARQAFNPADYA
jgi:hypothetical protein